MACPLMGLPDELQLWIIEKLQESGRDGFNGLVNLSSTCSRYRTLLAPTVFHTITLKNTVRSAESVLAVANKNSLAQYVKHLHFIGTLAQIDFIANPCGDLYGLLEDTKDAAWVSMVELDAKEVFPTVASNILSDLRLFPQLTMLTVSFDSDSWWGHPQSNSSMLTDLEHTDGSSQVEWVEQNVPYRALMSATFVTITRNTNHSITMLHLNLIPILVGAFGSTDWSEFLNPIQSCTVAIKGEFKARKIPRDENCCLARTCDDCQGAQCAGATTGYCYFISRLSQCFFEHLDSVTTLRIIASVSGPIWYVSEECGLGGNQLPKLRSLYVERVFVCHELGKFLATRKDVLEEITFQDCYGTVDFDYPNYPKGVGKCSWHCLLDYLSTANPTRLQSVEIRPLQEPLFLMAMESNLHWPDSGIEAIDLKVAQDLLANDPHRVAFPYAWLEDWDGLLDITDYYESEAFVQGDDVMSYNRLLAIVKANRATRLQV
ncbi:uncharacterized protein BDZ99DRAFT_528044 [Mytilinidion resinicola]|uniref:F-box domain-containing protein n=1 Tax=Mytilinidion resinicola TaxID=574789 RepID=A0A6A6XZK2_9PEZI|nr:uncharacterized protein BDZ99DRAFT_528044 [Mytilinidion resinicola]KAF2801829.1 hypothetical protein BDZ99DRAFT_528044 [Mytilinidion resinicola]